MSPVRVWVSTSFLFLTACTGELGGGGAGGDGTSDLVEGSMTSSSSEGAGGASSVASSSSASSSAASSSAASSSVSSSASTAESASASSTGSGAPDVPKPPFPTCADQGPIEAGDEPHSQHVFVGHASSDLVAATIDINVDSVLPSVGLKFFAIQVNWPNGTAAHGGWQDLEAHVLKANWGGLGALDYAVEQATVDQKKAALNLMQNTLPLSPDATWQTSRWYRYEVRRGPQTTLPPGDYSVLDEPPIHVEYERTMWAWVFTITDLETGAKAFEKTQYNADATFSSWMYWTETGYGIQCTDKMEILWREPTAESATTGPVGITNMVKSIDQSSCPNHATTDSVAWDPARHGVVQTFGGCRAADSVNYQALY